MIKGDETSSDPFLVKGVFTREAYPHETLENRVVRNKKHMLLLPKQANPVDRGGLIATCALQEL
ncbi:hypothetical protein YC2023_006365 [Brassica napus]